MNNPTLVGMIVFACTFGGVLLGMRLRHALPGHHLDPESKDTVKVGIGLIATMTALVLGLVTASAKSSFDAMDNAVKKSAVDVLTLDRVLARYGAETGEIRKSLQRVVGARMEMIWPQGAAKPADLDPMRSGAGVEAERLADAIRSLKPHDDNQRALQARALDLTESLLPGLIKLAHPPPVQGRVLHAVETLQFRPVGVEALDQLAQFARGGLGQLRQLGRHVVRSGPRRNRRGVRGQRSGSEHDQQGGKHAMGGHASDYSLPAPRGQTHTCVLMAGGLLQGGVADPAFPNARHPERSRRISVIFPDDSALGSDTLATSQKCPWPVTGSSGIITAILRLRSG